MGLGVAISALGLLKDAVPALGNIASKFLDGKATAEELAAEAAKHKLDAETQLALAQIQLNTVEASHSSLFVSGWRPFIGWCCGIALAFNFLIVPLLGAAGVNIIPLDTSVMMPVLLGLLGIGGMRTVEKIKGKARSSLEEY